MDQIERKDNDNIILMVKYDMVKVIITSHGISSSEVSGEMFILDQSTTSRRRPSTRKVGSSGSSTCH